MRFAIRTCARRPFRAPAVAGTTFTFSADIYGRTADSGRLAAGLGDFTVLDLYLANDHASDLRLLSVFNVDIALDAGAFVHHDADAEGHWSAAYNLIGANTALDSFATFGAMSGDDPFMAALDPNSTVVAGSVSTDAGWYNDDPSNDQGNVSAAGRSSSAGSWSPTTPTPRPPSPCRAISPTTSSRRACSSTATRRFSRCRRSPSPLALPPSGASDCWDADAVADPDSKVFGAVARDAASRPVGVQTHVGSPSNRPTSTGHRDDRATPGRCRGGVRISTRTVIQRPVIRPSSP